MLKRYKNEWNEKNIAYPIKHELPVLTCPKCKEMFVVIAFIPWEDGDRGNWVEQGMTDFCPNCGHKNTGKIIK